MSSPSGPSSIVDPAVVDSVCALLEQEPDLTELALAARVRATIGTARPDLAPDSLSTAISLAVTRRKALPELRKQFGERADDLLLTPTGWQQATHPEIAKRRARLLAGALRAQGLEPSVVDLGCGLGFDAFAFAREGLHVTGVERDALTAELAQHNAHALGLGHIVDVRHCDARQPEGAFYVDPARRTQTGRAMKPHQWSPAWDQVCAWASQVPVAVAKVAPGIDHSLVPARMEFVSVARQLRECTIWWGIPGPQSQAVVLHEDHWHTLQSEGTASIELEPGEFLVDPDPAIVRAGAVAEAAAMLGGGQLDSHVAYVTASGPAPRWMGRSFQLLWHGKLSQAIEEARGRGLRIAEILTRGIDLDIADLQRSCNRALDPRDQPAALVVTRVGSPRRRTLALIGVPAEHGLDDCGTS